MNILQRTAWSWVLVIEIIERHNPIHAVNLGVFVPQLRHTHFGLMDILPCLYVLEKTITHAFQELKSSRKRSLYRPRQLIETITENVLSDFRRDHATLRL
jgi:hypothetical protein